MLFEKGDYVEAIESDQCWPARRIVKGRIYEVAEVDIEFSSDSSCSGCGPDCGHAGIVLVGQPMPWYRRWCASSFRLVYRKRGSWVEALVASSSSG